MKFTSRSPISAADFALMLESMGVDRVIAVVCLPACCVVFDVTDTLTHNLVFHSQDLHSGQIQGYFEPSVPVTELSATVVGAQYFAKKVLLAVSSESTVG